MYIGVLSEESYILFSVAALRHCIQHRLIDVRTSADAGAMADLTPSLTDLAAQIQKNTAVIQTFLSENSIPPPSFDPNAFPFFPGTGPTGLDPFPAPSAAVLEARATLRQACETLFQLTTSPAELVVPYVCSYHATACSQYIYHFKVAEAVPVDGSITYSDLASATGTPELQLKRIMRQMMTHRYFHEPEPNHVAHTAGSKLLIPMRDFVGYITEESFPGGSYISATAEKFPNSEERNHSPWNLGHRIDQPIFEYFETDEPRRTRFYGNMNVVGGSEAWNIKHLVAGYDWKAVGKGTVVDVGGSIGHACLAVAEVAPDLDFVVQDLEKAVAGAPEYMKQQGKETANLKFQVHDFFTEEPVKDAAVYLLRFILHDYPDKYAVKILQGIVPAMGNHSRIIVMDGVVPDPGLVPRPDERVSR